MFYFIWHFSHRQSICMIISSLMLREHLQSNWCSTLLSHYFPFSWLCVEQPIAIIVLQKHCCNFAIHEKIFPILTCYIINVINDLTALIVNYVHTSVMSLTIYCRSQSWVHRVCVDHEEVILIPVLCQRLTLPTLRHRQQLVIIRGWVEL